MCGDSENEAHISTAATGESYVNSINSHDLVLNICLRTLGGNWTFISNKLPSKMPILEHSLQLIFWFCLNLWTHPPHSVKRQEHHYIWSCFIMPRGNSCFACLCVDTVFFLKWKSPWQQLQPLITEQWKWCWYVWGKLCSQNNVSLIMEWILSTNISIFKK